MKQVGPYQALEKGDWRPQLVKVCLSICSKEALCWDKYSLRVEQNRIQKDEGMKLYFM